MLVGLVLNGCASGSGKITNAEICIEIPFQDGAEGACVQTVKHQPQIYSAEAWRKRRPYMLMIHVESWTEIKKDWLKACRYAGPDCNVTLNSVDKVIDDLDRILKATMN